ncbi:MAG: di-heme oxidoredictase family protein [Bradymonadia bacterium]
MLPRPTCLFAYPLVVLALSACGDDTKTLSPEPGEELSGGDTTVFDVTRDAYARGARNFDSERRGEFFVGSSAFNQPWVTAPASTTGRDGLGPVFNARSCDACHFKDGRGRPPEPGEPMDSMLIRLSLPGVAENGGVVPVPGYGGQLNPFGILGVPGEGQVDIEWTEETGEYADGTPYSLRRPTYVFSEMAFGDLPPETLISGRTAPAVFGLGLLEAITEADLMAHADPDDADGDGVSGRPNRVWDVVAKAHRIGRFGWKSNNPSLIQQNAGAFLGDIGITTPLFPEENCAEGQTECVEAPTGALFDEDGQMMEAEVNARKLDRVTLYTQTLAVPARRNWDDPEVLAGKALFNEMGCATCHVPSFETGEFEGVPEVSNQKIWPYTDLLLHDMGEGLADGRPDFEATGREWRTAPLWGIGLLETVNRHTLLLHDGRARGFAEAILWHGGEAEAARERFRHLEAADRDRVVKFLESL